MWLTRPSFHDTDVLKYLCMRIIAGTYRSRPLRSLAGTDTRPTSDRLRETLFDVLTAGDPEALRGTAWLDLYAGTGAVGIEALSRGAAKAVLVDSSRAAVEVIRANLRALGIGDAAEVRQEDAQHALRALAKEVAGDVLRFDFCFFDPPYRLQRVYGETLRAIADSGLLAPAGIVVAEHDKRFDPGETAGPLVRYRLLKQGDAALSFYRVSSSQFPVPS